ncbi:RtcB family protein [Pseudomonas amygdali]|uniref:3'-phosphate/5'-hydroxy nucleic acid ligase n=2 Tax=Pseudomonas amygdali pv. lachrymans TaxID=53707 RepID=A0ABR5KR07_PSEAV|nr:RtcB family protein [Pseudomonas amygdali]AXH59523.1 RtcB family protein [Pseudomonas amygdali pv. lachrymans str. M301315]KPC16951.1 RNA-splicing ligase RtcB [Pseudomonas amygdali pv. lachrymans]KPC17910.1 RNA-splicing ligase RtcB [Pseudomonas amygdali pv. lachrymans]RMT06095.1 RNA-splicing ligase RtcB [Pseudomonas amygdali pv. lachrymans]
MKTVIAGEENARPIKIWTGDIEDAALTQLKNLSRLPFIARNGVAAMPDVHAGIGSTVGTVIATAKAIIPAAVGVDIGCGMNAVRLSLKASDLPESLKAIRSQIERDVPLGAGGRHNKDDQIQHNMGRLPDPTGRARYAIDKGVFKESVNGWDDAMKKAGTQLGTLGSGNHFIELCIDENQDVWIMLHSGSRGIGNMIGSHFIKEAQKLMDRWYIDLPDRNLAYLPEGAQEFEDYVEALSWAQEYAFKNRELMMEKVILALRRTIDKEFTITQEAINCHHNYATRENHFGENLWVTRKGAIRAQRGDLGIIPGSMGQRSYIVRGKGNAESYCSCSHGAGRKMSRSQARKEFTVADLKAQTEGVECLKTEAVLDEIPGAYKDIDVVMDNQKDLVEVVHVLKQVLCVKGA